MTDGRPDDEWDGGVAPSHGESVAAEVASQRERLADDASPHGEQPAGGDAPVQRAPIPALLAEMNRDHLDPGYAAAARRKAAAPAHAPDPGGRRRSVVLAAVILLVAGVLFGISAVNRETNAPRADKARAALLEDIDRAQERQSVLAGSAAGLADDLRSSQSQLGAGGPLQTVSSLENVGQVTPVTGPGLRIVINEPPVGSAAGGSVIRDRDVQLLVNDLWASGAEAIAIGGVRVQPRSAIRQAGGSILVDNKPVFWPITIDAIGDPTGMQVKSVGLPGFGRFSSFAQLYGIGFDVSTQQNLELPGGPAAPLLYARAPASSTATATTGPGAAGAGAGSGSESGSGSDLSPTASGPSGAGAGAQDSGAESPRPTTASSG